jgi:hypothetical protein
LDANDAAIVRDAAALNKALPFETIQRGGDGRDRGCQRLSDAADTPCLRCGQYLEQAHVVCMKVRIDTSGKQTRLDPELSHEYLDAFVEGKRLSVLDGAAISKKFLFHRQYVSSLFKHTVSPSGIAPESTDSDPAGSKLTFIPIVVYYDNRNIIGREGRCDSHGL